MSLLSKNKTENKIPKNGTKSIKGETLLTEYFFNKFVFQNEADKKELRNFSKNNLLANSD